MDLYIKPLAFLGWTFFELSFFSRAEKILVFLKTDSGGEGSWDQLYMFAQG